MQPVGARWCEEHKRYECVSPRKAGRGTCHGPVVTGSDKCRMHLGQKAAPVILQAQAERVLYRHDAAPVNNAIEALQLLAGRALALEEAIGEKVNEIKSIRYKTETGGEQLRAEIAVLERSMDRCGKLLVDIAKLNIEERLARVTERQAQMTMDALAAAMREMGLSAEQQQEARTRVARHLRVVTAG